MHQSDPTASTSTDLSRRGFLQSTAVTSAALGSGLLVSNAQAQKPAKQMAGPSGLKASIAAYSFRSQLPQPNKPGSISMGEWFEWVADQGIGAVEPTSYYFYKEDPAFIHSLKAKAFKLGLDISGTAIRNNFTHMDKSVRDESISHVKKWVDHSVKLGAPVIRIFAGNKHKQVSDKQALTWAIDCIKECCDYAGEHGTFLAIENHGYLTGTSADLMKIVDGVNHEWLGVNLDTGNFTEDPYGNIERMVPHAVNVQLKTEILKSKGKGREDADIPRIISLLNNGGYRGYVALEFEGDDGGNLKKVVSKHLHSLQQAIQQGASA